MFGVGQKLSILGEQGHVTGTVHKETEKAVCVKVPWKAIHATYYCWFPKSQMTEVQHEGAADDVLCFDVPAWMRFDGKRVDWLPRANRSSYYANNVY
jgi:hypothetical protein